MSLQKQEIIGKQRALRRLRQKMCLKARCCSLGADETRLSILHLLKKYGELCVSDIAAILAIGVSAASHQLALLERAEFVNKQKTGQTVFYSLNVNNKQRQIRCLLNL